MNIEKSYQETLDYLYSYVDYSLTKSDRYTVEKFDLGRMRLFVEKLGQPDRRYPIIHIAGTKGKGSVSAMCSHVLQAAGYRVGLYTSPHLHDYAERIQINNEPIPHADLVSLVDELRPLFAAIPELTTFEITTGLALAYFAREQVDAVVLEVGLGGRLDATNVVTPAVTVITSISLDHMFLLGDTLAAIAGEKCGIIKPGVPLICAPQQEEARSVIERRAIEAGAPLVQVGKDYLFAPISRSLQGQSMLVWQASEQQQVDEFIESGGVLEWEPTRLNLPLLGYHQVENAATAYATLQEFRQRARPLSAEAIQRGFANTQWPGRFEILQRSPIVVVDSAHNRDSARRLRLALDDYFPGQPVILLFGASEDKDVQGMFAELMPRVRRVIATKSFHPRAMEAERLVELAHQFGHPAVIVPDVGDALNEALRLASGDDLVLVTGSIFVVAGAREAWLTRKSMPVQV